MSDGNLVWYRFATLLMVLALIIPISVACGDPTTSSTNPSSTNLSTTLPSTSPLEHKLDVPFESQWARQLASPFQYTGNGQNGGGNCGPASLTMALHFYKKSVTFEQVVAAVRAQCTTGPCTGWTSFESSESVELLQQNGLDLVRNNGQIVNMGSFADIKSQIDQNHPVIMAVDNSYGKEKGIYGDGSVSDMENDHIVVVTGYRVSESGVVQTMFINDPLAIKKSSTGKWVADDREKFGKDLALTHDEFQKAADDYSGSQSWYGAAVVRTGKTATTPSPTTSAYLGTTIQYTGSIATSGDYQDWKYSGQAGDIITIRMFEDGGASLSPYVQLFDPSGTRVSSDSSDSEARIANYMLVFSGTYTIRASGGTYFGTTGGYRLNLTLKPPAATLVYGQEAKGQIVFAGDYQDWKFSGQAGDIITIRMFEDGGASLSPYVQLFDPSGTRVSSDSGDWEARIANYMLVFSGTYTIRASGGTYSGTTGGYRLSLNKN